MAMVQMLVDFGADVNARDKEDVGGYAPLHYAVQMNNYEVVELLLVNGANPNLADVKHGWACLHCAVRLKNNAIAKSQSSVVVHGCAGPRDSAERTL